MRIDIPWGDETLPLDVPPHWEIVQIASPRACPAVESVEAELRRALDHPIRHAPISDFVRPNHRVALVVDDIGRPTPAHRLLPEILDRLVAVGIPASKQTLVFATGLHRGLTEKEMVRKVGANVWGRIQCVNHDAKDVSNLVDLGATSRGTPVRFNRAVAEADVRILVGTIEPHVQAGFGGGCKNLLPGVAAAESIGANHFLGADPKLFSMIGFHPDRNPMRQDLEEAASKLRGTTFVVNTLLNASLEVARIVAGHAIHAHREGLRAAESMYGVRIDSAADIVITNSFPLDVNLRQDVKAVANVLFAARPDGAILALLRSRNGLDDIHLPPHGWVPLNTVRSLLRLLPSGSIRGLSTSPRTGIAVEERFFLYFALQALRRNRISIFSPTLSEQINGRFRGLPLHGKLEDAMRDVDRRKRRSRPKVLVFPAGGVTYPIMEGKA